MSSPIRLIVCAVDGFVRNVRTRMPFRYGKATLVAVPVLHLRTTVEDEHGRRAVGCSADCLPPGWFDKRPDRTFRDDIASLTAVVSDAIDVYLGGGRATAFEHWHRAYHEVRTRGEGRGENGLTCGFGPALVERSVIDAVGKLAGTTFHDTVRFGLLGIELGALHPELAGSRPADWLDPEPLATVGLRQTVGLLDPLTCADLTPERQLADGLPQTLEEYLAERGLRYLKVKLAAELDADLERIQVIARLLDRHTPGRYVITIDGNELYRSPADVLALLDAIASRPGLRRFYNAIEYIEQPFGRDTALDPTAVEGLVALSVEKPVVIDESDDSIEAFRRGAEIGYDGISIKNCKGVTKAIANRCLAAHLTRRRRRPRPYILTAEDLMNTPAVPLQQDLATAATLGVAHVERNGHHYVRGLDHLTPGEVEDCLEHHPDLYEPLRPDSAQLRICDGLLDLRSLNVPGYAVACEPDWPALTPLADWRFEDLGLAG